MGKNGTLGRWTQLKIEVNNEIKTTVIASYSPCKPGQTSYYSTYAQQTKCWVINGLKECAKNRFRKNLLEFIKLRKYKGDKIILMLDENENIQTRNLAKTLKSELYNMIDSIKTKVGNLKFLMYYRGQEQIDAIWIWKDLEAKKVMALPFFFGIGDYQGF